MKNFKFIITFLFVLPFSLTSIAGPTGQDLGDNWCSDVKMHFYAGGPEAGGFAGIVAAGAAGKVVRGVAKSAAEVAESFVDLVEEAKSEAVSNDSVDDETKTDDAKKSSATITEVTVE